MKNLTKQFTGTISKIGITIVLFILIIFFSILSPRFLSVTNIFNIFIQVAVIAVMAAGMTFVIITGGIDLSVGSILGLSAVVTSLLMAKYGFSMGMAVVVGILVGGLCGLVNGALISFLGVTPFIATLGMMSVARGLAYIITNGVGVYGLPMEYSWIAQGRIFGVIPVAIIIMIVVYLIFYFILNNTAFGRHLYAIGSNVESARLAGVNISKTLLIAYTICGLLSGFSGVILSSRLLGGLPTAGTGYELDVIAGVILGGASLFGGEGNISGTIVGVLLMGVIRNGCDLIGVSTFWQTVIIGLVIWIAVIYDTYRRKSAGLT